MEKLAFKGDSAKFFLMKDDFNKARSSHIYDALELRLNVVDNPQDSDCFIAVGGDGTLLKAVTNPDRGARPILALNSGTVGKNLIDVDGEKLDHLISDLLNNKCFQIKFPMIEVLAICANEKITTYHAFNDAWVDRASVRSVRYRMSVEDSELANFDCGPIDLCDDFISGDGVLVCTPVGSTGYARMLGEMVLPLHTKTFLVNPMASMVDKRKVHAFALDYKQTLHVSFEDLDFRPNSLAIDGCDYDHAGDLIKGLRVRMANPDEKSVVIIHNNMSSFIRKQLDFIAR